jgi:hypothetical protein
VEDCKVTFLFEATILSKLGFLLRQYKGANMRIDTASQLDGAFIYSEASAAWSIK